MGGSKLFMIDERLFICFIIHLQHRAPGRPHFCHRRWRGHG